MSISKDERERAKFRSRRIYLADMESNMLTAIDNARAEEREKMQDIIADKDAEIAGKDAEIKRLLDMLNNK